MGNAALRDLAVIEEVPFDELGGGVVAVDAHNWLYKYLTTTVKWTNESVYTTADGTEVANLLGLVQGLPKFFEHELTPVFVFDGAVVDLKEEEIEQRREAKRDAEERMQEAREAGDAVEAARMEARTQRLTDTIHETTRELLDVLDVPFVEAPGEGEAQIAHMARTDSDVTHAGSDDYDTLLFGAPLTLRQLTSKGDPELMDLDATLAEHEVSLAQLVDVAMLCGTDFNEGLSGFGPKTSMKKVKEYGDLWGVLDAEGAEMENAETIRRLFLEPNVTDDYELDLALDPDVPAARAYVSETWEVPADEVARGFERIEESVTQTGLDQWT